MSQSDASSASACAQEDGLNLKIHTGRVRHVNQGEECVLTVGRLAVSAHPAYVPHDFQER